MFGLIAKIRPTGRHDVALFPFAMCIDEGAPVFGSVGERRHRAIFLDDLAEPTRFAWANLYDPVEVETWAGVLDYPLAVALLLMARATERNA